MPHPAGPAEAATEPAAEPGIAAALRALLPADVALSQGYIADAAASPLFPAEAAAISRAVPSRRAEFAAGRHHARLALRQAAGPPGAIAVGPARQALWPPGWVGSITHDAQWCAAAVARGTGCIGLGIDIERVERFDAALEGVIATAAERAQWPHGLDAAARRVHLARVFSAKEACFKAHFPSTAAWLDFTDAEVSLPAADSGGFTLRLLKPAGRYAADHVFQGGSAVAGERVCAVVFLPRS